ncbi:ABC transporter ATP-binding protein [Roseinatronobacter monicus]|uniref:ATP-binding cassette domain-containing protein n=1 Tax=Roseinatronobacter monicus TaxID=393481 RepID=UPI001FE923FC|nr:ABC transporter ATP-binding protein [Roseinatronobacter monicus]
MKPMLRILIIYLQHSSLPAILQIRHPPQLNRNERGNVENLAGGPVILALGNLALVATAFAAAHHQSTGYVASGEIWFKDTLINAPLPHQLRHPIPIWLSGGQKQRIACAMATQTKEAMHTHLAGSKWKTSLLICSTNPEIRAHSLTAERASTCSMKAASATLMALPGRWCRISAIPIRVFWPR